MRAVLQCFACAIAVLLFIPASFVLIAQDNFASSVGAVACLTVGIAAFFSGIRFASAVKTNEALNG